MRGLLWPSLNWSLQLLVDINIVKQEVFMELLSKVWTWLCSPVGVAAVACLTTFVFEVLGSMEFFKKSSIFVYVVDALKWIKGKLSPAA